MRNQLNRPVWTTFQISKDAAKTFEVILFAQVRAQRLSVFSLNPGERTAIGDLDVALTVVGKSAEFWLRVLLVGGVGRSRLEFDAFCGGGGEGWIVVVLWADWRVFDLLWSATSDWRLSLSFSGSWCRRSQIHRLRLVHYTQAHRFFAISYLLVLFSLLFSKYQKCEKFDFEFSIFSSTCYSKQVLDNEWSWWLPPIMYRMPSARPAHLFGALWRAHRALGRRSSTAAEVDGRDAGWTGDPVVPTNGNY